jgi:ribose transport system substrate-binding protein
MSGSKKSFGSLFAALILAGLLLPGCQAAQTPPPQAEAPVPTVESTEISGGPATPTVTLAKSITSTPHLSIPATPDKEPLPTLAFISGSDDPFYITMLTGIMQSASDAGVEVITQIPKTLDPAVQIPLIEEMMARGDVDYLIVAPTDRDQLIPVLEQAHQAGISIITVDTYIGDGDYEKGAVTFPLSYIGSDNFRGGFLACNTLANVLGEGAKIYIENVRPGISATDQREAGCQAAAVASGLEVVGVNYSENQADLAQEHVTAALVANPDIGGIFGVNIASAQGAGMAVQAAKVDGIEVVAFDAAEFAVSLLQEGRVTQVIAQKPFDMGYLAVALAVAHAKGFQSVPAHLLTGYAVMNVDNIDQPEMARFIYTTGEGPLEPPPKDSTLAFVPGVNPDPFFITMSKGANEAAALYGVNLIQGDPPAFNPEAQTPVIEAMFSQNDVDYLITAPTDKEAMIPVLQRIHNRGIPVITVDTFIGDGDYRDGPVTFPITYIGSDNVGGGYVGCSTLALADITGAGPAIYIQSTRRGISTMDQRVEGCLAAAQDFDLKVVAVEYADTTGVNTDQENVASAQAQTTRVLTDNPDIVGVFGANTFAAQGAGQAVANAGLGGTVEVIAFDASTFAIDLLRQGTVTQVVAQKPGDIGYFAVLVAVAHAQGVSSIPARWSTGFAVINKNNVDDPNFARFIYQDE